MAPDAHGTTTCLWKGFVNLCSFAFSFSTLQRCFLRLRALPGAGSDRISPLSYLTPLPHDLIRSKIPGRVEASLLHPKGCDEDVEDDCDKDESCGSVVEYIQAGLLCNIIQIQTSCAIQCKKKGRLVA